MIDESELPPSASERVKMQTTYFWPQMSKVCGKERDVPLKMRAAQAVQIFAILCIVGINFLIPLAAKAEPSHGPEKGYLLLNGGVGDPYRFIAMAGGSKAHIVYIPTADVAKPGVVMSPDAPASQGFCRIVSHVTGAQCTVLHADNPNIANSEAFLAPLKDATGVWFTGGEPWRLADAYLGTNLLTDLAKVLDRGGVIGGNSAGAMIQASLLIRGGKGKDKFDRANIIAPERHTGFGFFTNTAIDVHVDGTRREDELADVLRDRPGILGLGIDNATSIIVHGDTLTVSGEGRVAVWDGANHNGRGHYHLRNGDTLDTASRVATILPQNSSQNDQKPEEMAVSKDLALRIKDQVRMPDSEAKLRRYIAELQNARLDTVPMDGVSNLPNKQQLALLHLNASAFGALQSVSFIEVSREGADVYDIKFANIREPWRVRIAPDGKVQGVDYRTFRRITELLH